ncbi:UNVERIFIED_CONTAM: hypothetical protein Sindi_1531900 [Sesamum indicum]
MSWEYDFSALDYPTAVAAAAYAIQSLEESKSRDQNLTTYGPDKSLNKMRSRAEDTEETLRRNYKDPDIKMPISASRSKKMTEKAADPGPPSKDKISFVDTNKTTSKKPANSAGQMAPERAPSMGRPPTFADKHLDIGESEKPETPQPKSDSPPTRWSTTQPVDPRRQTATKPGPADSMADAWEKEKMASIQERYERLTAIIDDWEINKKKKANRKMERIEAKPENKRAEAVQRHQEEIKRIEEIAGGARAQAEKNRRKEELKEVGNGNRNPSKPTHAQHTVNPNRQQDMEIDGKPTTQIKEGDLFKAAESGDSSLFKSLSEEQLLKASSLRNEDGRSLLHVAVSSSKREVVEILSAASPSVVNSSDEEGWAPLHSAASSGNVEIVEILLSRGADVNLKNDGGRTALHYAASKGQLKIAAILVSHGAKLNVKDKVGCTPLHRAASTGNAELCEFLIEEGAEVDDVDRAGQTALMTAVVCDNKEVALLLIRHGADVDAKDKEGYTVLGRASDGLRPILIDAAKAMLED